MAGKETRERLLDVAEELSQTQGFNAFSYRHLAERLGIKAATIHYYFPAKADLGRELILRYRERFDQAASRIDASAKNARGKLDRYGNAFVKTFQTGGRLCLCASFASDFLTLPEPVQDEVRAYVRANEAWLERVLEEGRAVGELDFEEDAATVARVLFHALEGAMLGARAHASPKRIRDTKNWILKQIVGA